MNQLASGQPVAVMRRMAEHLAEQHNTLANRSLARKSDVDSDREEAMAALGYVGGGAAGSSAPDGSIGWPQR